MTGRIIVVGLGPGDPTLVSSGATQAIAAIPRRYLRTTRHPSAHLASPAVSFDQAYETSSSLDEVYASIVETLVEASGNDEAVLYAVPGSPLVAERTVAMLREDPRVRLEIVPSVSFVDLAWERLRIDPMASGVRLVDGHRFAVDAAGGTGPFLVGQCDSAMTLSDIKLSVEDGPRVTVMQRLGLGDERVFDVDWSDLDRSFEADHLTCIWVPTLASPVAAELTRFAELVRLLRARCPWDARQTHASLSRHLLEESYELLEAIDGLDGPGGYEHLEEELGDVLFQVAFHANLAAEAGEFDLSDVARSIHDKLVERHPHVFGPPGTEVANWEEAKKVEKGRTSIMDGIPAALPSLMYAHKVQSRAASVGFDWDDAAGAWAKVVEELAELQAAVEAGAAGSDAIGEELGDVLFSIVNVARHLGVDAETCLRAAAAKFAGRFVAMELLASERSVAISDDLWDEVKAARARRDASGGSASHAGSRKVALSAPTTGAAPDL